MKGECWRTAFLRPRPARLRKIFVFVLWARAEDFADDGLEGVGREVCDRALEDHAFVWGPDDR